MHEPAGSRLGVKEWTVQLSAEQVHSSRGQKRVANLWYNTWPMITFPTAGLSLVDHLRSRYHDRLPKPLSHVALNAKIVNICVSNYEDVEYAMVFRG